ncbi:MAG: hypothetical protein NWQ28_13990, partial [Nodularia sp. (in: cyanobacteria)]|nr:hypothetical protein [Nodularia sp. (in: cyanobacteria)]
MTDKSQPEIEVNKDHKSVCEAVGEVGAAITHTAAEAGKIVLDTSIGAGVVAAKETYKLIAKGTQSTGDLVNHISENWLIRKLTGVLNLNWLISPSESVDLEKAEASV